MKLHHLASAAVTLGLLAAGVATPAMAAGGRTTQEMTCDGQQVTLSVSPGHDGNNWGAAQVVGGGTLIPVSLEFRVYDDTAAMTLDDEVQQHGTAHSRQPTITCQVSQEAILRDVIPAGFVLPDGVALSDHITSSFIVTAVRPHA